MLEAQKCKTCRYCGATKEVKLFRYNRNQCLDCKAAYLKAYNDKKRKNKPVKVKVVQTSKTCSKCNETKPIEMFGKTGRICPPCKKIEHQKWHKEIAKELASIGLFVEINGAKLKARQCNCCSEIKEVRFFKQISQTCIDCKAPTKPEVLERQKKRQELEAKATHRTCIRCDLSKKIGEGISNKRNPYCRDCSNELNRAKYVKNGGKDYFRIKRQTNISYNIESKLRGRLRGALKEGNATKRLRTEELVGCSFEKFREHLKSNLREGMTMEKVLSAEVVIDHIIPCALFDLTNEEEQKKCFHYTNLQPLWMRENAIKADFYFGMNWGKVPKSIKKIDSLTKMTDEVYNLD